MARGFGASGSNGLGVANTDLVKTAFVGAVTTQASWSFWLYTNTATSFCRVLAYSSGSGTNPVINFSSSSLLSFVIPFSTTNGNFTVTQPALSKWNHLAITYDAGNVANVPSIYLNGVAQSVSTLSTPVGAFNPTSTDTHIIGNSGAANVVFLGMIAHASYWKNTLLTKGEVLSLYHGLPSILIRPDSLGFYLPLDGVSNSEPDYINVLSGSISGTRLGISEPPVAPMARYSPRFNSIIPMAFINRRTLGPRVGSRSVY